MLLNYFLTSIILDNLFPSCLYIYIFFSIIMLLCKPYGLISDVIYIHGLLYLCNYFIMWMYLIKQTMYIVFYLLHSILSIFILKY